MMTSFVEGLRKSADFRVLTRDLGVSNGMSTPAVASKGAGEERGRRARGGGRRGRTRSGGGDGGEMEEKNVSFTKEEKEDDNRFVCAGAVVLVNVIATSATTGVITPAFE